MPTKNSTNHFIDEGALEDQITHLVNALLVNPMVAGVEVTTLKDLEKMREMCDDVEMIEEEQYDQ